MDVRRNRCLPNCQIEIKPTESLAAALLESTKMAYEQRFEAEGRIQQREIALREQQAELSKSKEKIGDDFAQRIAEIYSEQPIS